jgi:hypothetical protein
LQDNADLIFVPKSQSAPASWDWREKGAITPVKNQGQLGDVQSIVTEGNEYKVIFFIPSLFHYIFLVEYKYRKFW